MYYLDIAKKRDIFVYECNVQIFEKCQLNVYILISNTQFIILTKPFFT